MTVTYSQLQTRVLTRLIDTPTAVQSEVPQLINDAIHVLEGVHNFRCMKAEVTFNTTVASHLLGQIPTNWKEPLDKPYYVLSQGATREILWQPSRSLMYRMWDPFDPNTKGPPRGLLLGEPTNGSDPDPINPDYDMTDLNIEVYPYPDGLSDWTTSPAGEYRIHIPYYQYLPDLSAGTDHNWFTTHCDQFIICFATSLGFSLDWDEPRAGYWMQQAIGPKGDLASVGTLGGFAKAAFAKDRSIAMAPGKNLVPRRDVFAARDQWRT